MNQEEIRRHWNEFYATSARRLPKFPSQFAAFVAGEIPEGSRIVEYGCGSGRDTEFLASLGHEIVGLDESSSAIQGCIGCSHGRASYLRLDIASSTSFLEGFVLKGGHVVIYARFFLHAISETEEDSFLHMLSRLLKPSAMVAFEYRTREDVVGEKSFGNHYRRFVDHSALCRKLLHCGFEILYQIRGRGLAKYKSEDAEVGRVICRKVAI
jgi:2-polyprenyl-3-methyl-5-hydroxy-6-metoxy-1,4-benzoquinol methylase